MCEVKTTRILLVNDILVADYSPAPAPGNFESKDLSYFASSGQPRSARMGFKASVNFWTAARTFPSRPLRISGAAELTAAQAALLTK